MYLSQVQAGAVQAVQSGCRASRDILVRNRLHSNGLVCGMCGCIDSQNADNCRTVVGVKCCDIC